MVDDPRLEGYLPIDYFRTTDHDRSSRRVRDFPSGKPRFKGVIGPSELNFGSIPKDALSPVQIGIITNTGYDNLPITAITVVGDYTITSDCPSSLAPGESCHVSITFNPKREGMITGGVYLDTGNAQGTEFIKLRGSGTPSETNPGGGTNTPHADFSPENLSFGQVEISSLSAPRQVILTNSGTARLTIANIVAPAQYSQTNDCGSGLDAGDSCTINVKFAPTSEGLKSGNLVINHNATDTKYVPLTGTGIGETTLPVISISDGVIEIRSGGNPDFSLPSPTFSLGSADFGETGEGIFFITGSAEASIAITTLPSSGSGFTFAFSGASTGPFVSETSHVIPEDGKLYVRARLTGAPGDYSKLVTFASAYQTEHMVITGTIEEEVVEPGEMARIRIVGNQFYRAVDEDDLGGTLPEEGGFRLASVNWFGGEGTNKTPNGTWAVGWKDIIDHIADIGFNCIRLPFSGTMMSATPPVEAFNAEMNPEFVGQTSLQIFDLIIEYCETKGIYIVLDHHRRSAGNGADGAPTDGSYTKAQWKADWLTMANRYKDNTNVVGADLHNEPHDLTWDDWADLVEEVGDHIHTVAEDWIIFCEGVGNIDSDYYWWGGQLKGVEARPIVLSTTHARVAYSPHEYGQSVGAQAWLERDSNHPVGWPTNLAAIWGAYWGYIYYDNIAPIWIGEMGGHFGLNPGTGVEDKPYKTEETAWMTHLVMYLNGDQNINGSISGGEVLPTGHKGLSFAWWAFNSNSADTGGLILDDWVTEQTGKITLIQPLL